MAGVAADPPGAAPPLAKRDPDLIEDRRQIPAAAPVEAEDAGHEQCIVGSDRLGPAFELIIDRRPPLAPDTRESEYGCSGFGASSRAYATAWVTDIPARRADAIERAASPS